MKSALTERPPLWDDEGWKGSAQDWMRKAGGFGRAPELVKAGSISYVMRGPGLYFKCAAKLPLFANEARVMRGLSGMFPQVIPRPLAVEEEQGWLLLPDLGPSVGESGGQARQAVMRELAQLQLASVGKGPALLAAGCLDRRLSVLAGQVDPLMASLENFEGLGPETAEKARGLAPRLKQLCGDLEAEGLPYTLVHGDFHLGNAAFSREGHMIYDWTDACYAHPFMDLHTTYTSSSAAAREAYMNEWRGRYSAAKLASAFRLAHPLIALHQAVSYQHIMINGFRGASKEFDWAMPHWISRVISTVPA